MTMQRKAPATQTFSTLAVPTQIVTNHGDGVTLHTIDYGTLPACGVSVIWECGKAELGLPAVFLPSLMTEGLPGKDSGAVAREIDMLGGFLNPRAGRHYGSLTLMGLSENMPRLLDLMRGMILTPTLPENSFNHLKARKVAARKVDLSKMASRASDMAHTLYMGRNHPYALPVAPEQYAAVNYSDMAKAHQAMRTNGHIHVFASGNMTPGFNEALIEFCNAVAPTGQPAPIKLQQAAHEPSGDVFIEMPGAGQCAVVCSIPTIGRQDAEYAELRHLITALGGYFGSRLMANVREKQGLTYGISAQLLGDHEGGCIRILASCDPAYRMRVLDAINSEIHKLCSQPMPDYELELVKREITRNLAQVLETPFSVADYYENNIIVGTPSNYFDAQFSSITRMTPQRIQELALKYLDTAPRHRVIAGTDGFV